MIKNNPKSKEKKGFVIWFTGLSGAGKTTLSQALKNKIKDEFSLIKVLDGDQLRTGINSNLGFSESDRIENIRRAAEIAKLFVESNFITLCAFITPTEKMRSIAREIIGNENFIEVYVECSLNMCEKRDVKGLYKKARIGNISNFTGVSSKFEPPKKSEIIINTEFTNIEESITLIYNQIMNILK